MGEKTSPLSMALAAMSWRRSAREKRKARSRGMLGRESVIHFVAVEVAVEVALLFGQLRNEA